MRTLRRNWRELVVPVLLIILAGPIFGWGFSLFGGIMFLIGMVVGAVWD